MCPFFKRCKQYVKLFLNNNLPHAIVSFNTTDKGIVFFEPQTDDLVELEAGKDYWTECIKNSTLDYEKNKKNIVNSWIIYW